MQVISQGSTRRGNFAAYLPVDHPDIMEFLKIRSEGFYIQDISFGVCVSDEWLQSMIDGDIDKRRVWAKVLETRSNVGYPYIFFTDTANRDTVDVYKDKGMKIEHSNLCITGDQRVVTSLGYLKAEDLYELNEELILFNGSTEVKSSKMKLRESSADVFKITLENGLEHKVTSYHKLPVITGSRGQRVNEVSCKDLKVGDKIAIQTNKGLFGPLNMEDEAFLLGLYQSDGTQYQDIIMLDLWENDFDLEEEIQDSFNAVYYKYGCDVYETTNQTGKTFTKSIEPAKFHECTVTQSTVRKRRLSSKTLYKALKFAKGKVPEWIWKSDEKTQWKYLKGLLYADGTVFVSTSNGNPLQLSYADTNLDFLKELQLLFNNLGLQSSIKLLRKEGEVLLPDGKVGSKDYLCNSCYRLVIGSKNSALDIERHTGLLTKKGIEIENRVYRDNSKKSSKVLSIEHVGKERVYCPTVYNDEHLFVCQGMKTFNCTEIFLPTNAEEAFVGN
jgi:ribonucleoside-diphosphate reductase alpha chain